MRLDRWPLWVGTAPIPRVMTVAMKTRIQGARAPLLIAPGGSKVWPQDMQIERLVGGGVLALCHRNLNRTKPKWK